MYRVWCYLWFQASTKGLGRESPGIREDHCISYLVPNRHSMMLILSLSLSMSSWWITRILDLDKPEALNRLCWNTQTICWNRFWGILFTQDIASNILQRCLGSWRCKDEDDPGPFPPELKPNEEERPIDRILHSDVMLVRHGICFLKLWITSDRKPNP